MNRILIAVAVAGSDTTPPESSDPVLGHVEVVAEYGSEIVVRAVPADGASFYGWFSAGDAMVSDRMFETFDIGVVDGVQAVLIIAGAVSAADGLHIDVGLPGAGVMACDAVEGHGSAAGGDDVFGIDLREGAEDHVGQPLGGGLPVKGGSRFAGADDGSGLRLHLDAVKEAGVGRDRLIQQAFDGVVDRGQKGAPYAVVGARHLGMASREVKEDPVSVYGELYADLKIPVSASVVV